MPNVKNVGPGIYADGVIFVGPGEEVEVSEEKAKYLCSDDSPGKFELVAPVVKGVEVKAAKPAEKAKSSGSALRGGETSA